MLYHPSTDVASDGLSVCSLAWDSANLVIQVCRRSWKRICSPALFSPARHAERQDLIGREGSILSLSGCSRSIPAASHAGKTSSSTFDSTKRPAHLIRASKAG